MVMAAADLASMMTEAEETWRGWPHRQLRLWDRQSGHRAVQGTRGRARGPWRPRGIVAPEGARMEDGALDDASGAGPERWEPSRRL